jgi:hypothetical protein
MPTAYGLPMCTAATTYRSGRSVIVISLPTKRGAPQLPSLDCLNFLCCGGAFIQGAAVIDGSQAAHITCRKRISTFEDTGTKSMPSANGIPFNATGEKIRDSDLWRVYEFTWQLDAMQFWDRFEGRWLRGSEFQ